MVLVEGCVDLLEILLRVKDGALVLVALSAVDQLVNDFFKRVHVLELVVDDAALDEIIAYLYLRMPQPNLIVLPALISQLILLAYELLLHDSKHITVEGPINFEFAWVSLRVHKLSSHGFADLGDSVRDICPVSGDFLLDYFDVASLLGLIFDAVSEKECVGPRKLCKLLFC